MSCINCNCLFKLYLYNNIFYDCARFIVRIIAEQRYTCATADICIFYKRSNYYWNRRLLYFDNSEDALHSESCDIDTLKPAFNVVGNKNFEEQDIEEVKRKLEIVEKEVKDARKVKLYAIYTSKKYLKIAEMACEIGVSVRTVKYWLKELRNIGFIE